MNLQDQDKLTRRGFVAGLIGTAVAKGLPLPDGLGTPEKVQAAGWTNATPTSQWNYVMRWVVVLSESVTDTSVRLRATN